MGDGEMADLEKNVGLLSSYIRVPPDEERFYKKKQSSEKYLKNGLILVGTSLLVFWLTWLTIRTGAADRDSLGDILATEELMELKQLQSQLHFQLMNKTITSATLVSSSRRPRRSVQISRASRSLSFSRVGSPHRRSLNAWKTYCPSSPSTPRPTATLGAR